MDGANAQLLALYIFVSDIRASQFKFHLLVTLPLVTGSLSAGHLCNLLAQRVDILLKNDI